MRRITGLIAVLALFALAPAALADRILVPEDAATVQAAVDAAQPGDRIIVKGTYTENVVVKDKTDLVIRGVRGATINGSADTGDFPDALHIQDCVDVEVRGLTLREAARHNLYSTGSTGVRISKCTFVWGDDGDGVAIENGDDVVVERCVFDDPSFWGVYIASTNSVVRKNRFILGGFDGIYVAPGATGCRVEKNRLDGPEGDGIVVFGEDILVRKNTVLNTETIGIVVQGPSDRVIVERNKVIESGTRGIYVTGPNAVVRLNKVSAAGTSGYELSADGTRVEKNRSKDAVQAGFRVEGEGITLSRNRAKGSGTFDLVDVAASGANTYDRNKFGTTDAP